MGFLVLGYYARRQSNQKECVELSITRDNQHIQTNRLRMDEKLRYGYRSPFILHALYKMDVAGYRWSATAWEI